MDIGERIAQIRGRMTREEFVEGLDIHAQSLYKYEKGKRQPDINTIRNICDKYKVSADWLIFGIEPIYRSSVATNSTHQPEINGDIELSVHRLRMRVVELEAQASAHVAELKSKDDVANAYKEAFEALRDIGAKGGGFTSDAPVSAPSAPSISLTNDE